MSQGARHAVLLDFDGTASTTDVGGELLAHFAADSTWQAIDNDYLTGRTGSRAAYRLAQGLLHHDPAAWLAFALSRGRLDPGFADLARLCRRRGWSLEILSDGLEFYIHALLEQAGWALPVRANRAVVGGRGLEIHTPYMNPRCGRCGTCKSARVEELRQRGWIVTYVGDGYSDLCAAPRAHRIFAKGVLAAHCAAAGVAHQAFVSLDQVAKLLTTTAGAPTTTPATNGRPIPCR